jgi:hypothetical protein
MGFGSGSAKLHFENIRYRWKMFFFSVISIPKKNPDPGPKFRIRFPVSFPQLITLHAGRCGHSTHTMVWPGAGLQRPSDGPIGSITGGPLQLLLQVRMHFLLKKSWWSRCGERGRPKAGLLTVLRIRICTDPLYFGKPHPDLLQVLRIHNDWLLPY